MKIVIAGSAKLEDEMQKWVRYWNEQKDCSVLNYPRNISAADFERLYPSIHEKFFRDITETDVLFVANEKKDEIEGYIGTETFAELSFGVAQKLVYQKPIRIILAHMPSHNVACRSEIELWLKLGWIDQVLEQRIETNDV